MGRGDELTSLAMAVAGTWQPQGAESQLLVGHMYRIADPRDPWAPVKVCTCPTSIPLSEGALNGIKFIK